jgi:hypothetical protein
LKRYSTIVIDIQFVPSFMNKYDKKISSNLKDIYQNQELSKELCYGFTSNNTTIFNYFTWYLVRASTFPNFHFFNTFIYLVNSKWSICYLVYKWIIYFLRYIIFNFSFKIFIIIEGLALLLKILNDFWKTSLKLNLIIRFLMF